MQLGCKDYLLQTEQIPFTTILTLSREKLLGRLILGTEMSLKQYVWLHFVHKKWTWRSFGWHSQESLHRAYFIEPVPSSILCISLFFSNVLSVRYKVALSAFSNLFSNSGKLIAVLCLVNTCKTNCRIAVGLIFFKLSLLSISFFILLISIISVCSKLKCNN